MLIVACQLYIFSMVSDNVRNLWITNRPLLRAWFSKDRQTYMLVLFGFKFRCTVPKLCGFTATTFRSDCAHIFRFIMLGLTFCETRRQRNEEKSIYKYPRRGDHIPIAALSTTRKSASHRQSHIPFHRNTEWTFRYGFYAQWCASKRCPAHCSVLAIITPLARAALITHSRRVTACDEVWLLMDTDMFMADGMRRVFYHPGRDGSKTRRQIYGWGIVKWREYIYLASCCFWIVVRFMRKVLMALRAHEHQTH